MTNRITIFTESVSKLNLPKPAFEALTQLAKACFESAIGLYDDLDSQEAYDDEDIENSLDMDSEDEARNGDIFDVNGVDASTVSDGLSYHRQEYDLSDNITESDQIESNTGTKIANAYIQLAPQLFDMKVCTFDDISSLSNFIDWLISKFEAIDLDALFKKSKNTYTDEIDKVLKVNTDGPKVVQLLKEIKGKCGSELGSASITNESSIFPIAKDINNYVTGEYGTDDNGPEGADNSFATASSFGYANPDTVGFTDEERAAAKEASMAAESDEFAKNYARNTKKDEDTNDQSSDGDNANTVDGADNSSLGEPASMAAESNELAKNYARNTKKKKEVPMGQFSLGDDVDTVDGAVETFLNIVPTLGLSKVQVTALKKPNIRKNKAIVKQIASIVDSTKKENKGTVVDTSALEKKTAGLWDDSDL